MTNLAVVGVVDRAFTKVKKTRLGDKTINYLNVNGLEVSTGFKADHTTGEHINIAVEHKFGEWQKVQGLTGDGLPPCDGAAAVEAAVTAPTSRSKGRGTFPIDPKDGQMAIIRQNSMNRAVEIMKQYTDLGLFTPVNQEAYLHKLHEIALNITDFNSGQDFLKAMAMAANKELIDS